ncbi:hypothetical protein ACI2LJ_35955 [Streptomyces sp. NPDC088090]|uniref:hypothetical protein n=1 Tax=Streptomyces sp. NPDC088090 TaxID=3365822 RepID=UPI00384CBFE2
MDAVRRQHQRDAYATFLEAAYSFQTRTEPALIIERVLREITDHASVDAPERVERRSRELRFEGSSLEDLNRAFPLVVLEGPDHVADLAVAVIVAAGEVRLNALDDDLSQGSDAAAGERTVGTQSDLLMAIDAFATGASAHLNGTRTGR